MTNWNPDIRSTLNLISRVWLVDPTTGQVVIAPTGATIIRASGVGAGGWSNTQTVAGHGAAFSRTKASCAAGESFTAKIGNISASMDAGSAAGDTQLLRTTGSVSILLAKRGTATGPGLASAGTGDTKRDGGTAGGQQSTSWPDGTIYRYSCGGCPGDLDDDYSFGLGGYPPSIGWNSTLFAAPGCGGISNAMLYRNGPQTVQRSLTLTPGMGRMVVEFYRTDPGY